MHGAKSRRRSDRMVQELVESRSRGMVVLARLGEVEDEYRHGKLKFWGISNVFHPLSRQLIISVRSGL